MKVAFIFGLVLLGAYHIDAKHAKHHKKKTVTPEDHEISTQAAEKPAEDFSPEPAPPFGGFAFPGFRIRIPILNFGVLGRMKQQIENIMKAKEGHGLADFTPGYKGKTKTRTKTSNSTHGPFKTYTITTETVTEGNKTVEPKVIAKSVKTITTLDKSKLPKGQNGTILPLAMGPRFGQASEDLAPNGKKCHASGDCAANMEFCDAYYGVCRKLYHPGDSCTQKDACDSQGGRYRCTWGRCVLNSYEGSAGTFCDSDSECYGSATEELGCFRQPDLSKSTSVCTAKLSEGATCGRAGIFDLFKRDDELSSRCRSGLQCRAVGFFGRKACIRPLSDGLSDSNDEIHEDNNEESEEHKKKDDGKKQKVQHKKKDKKLKF